MYQRPDAPRSIGGTLDDGFRLFKACFSQVFILAFIAAVIGQIPSVMMSSGVTAESPLPQFTVGLGVSFVLAALGAALLYGTIIAKIESIANNQPEPILDGNVKASYLI